MIMATSAVKKAVVIGIWGRAGGDGIPGLIKELSPRLELLGVPATNIFSMSWNPDHNDDAFTSPDFESHRRAIVDRGGGSGSAYIAIIGHSYGGWAACLLSRNIKPQPRYVALIDPVFGPTGDLEPIVEPIVNQHPGAGGIIHNWYQRNSITEPTVVEDCTGVVFGCPGGVSCGRSIPGVNNHEVKWQFTWNGNRKRRSCPGGRKGRHSYHLNIDSDRFVWGQIIEQIEADVRAL
jgi:hypothetical protein